MDLAERLRNVVASRYRVERELGRGGMSVVFLADDPRHGRRVAIKVLRPDLASAIGFDRFLREIAVASRLQHPNILPLYDSGSGDGLLFYVMPFVEGESLRGRLRREHQLPIADALRLAHEVADALAYAHGLGVVHRDIKPDNILLSGGHAAVADFGIARALTQAASEERLTETGITLGTPSYMSPEQASGDAAVDGRADIYSLGCVLYEMLGGEPPFTGSTAQAVLARHMLDTVPPLRTVRATVPAALEQVVNRALAKVPADRFTGAHQFADALTRVATGDESAGPATPTRGPRARRFLRTWIGLGIVGIIAAGTLWTWRATRPALQRHDWVLVADFDGGASEQRLAEAVRELVTAELDQSRYVRTVSRSQVNAAMRLADMPETTRVDVTRARQLAVRTSIRAVVAGTVTPLGDSSYSIALHLVSAENGRGLVSVAGAATAAHLIPDVQDVARRLRAALGENRRELAATLPLNQVVTPSYPAYRAYIDALAMQQRGELDSSNLSLRAALAMDTAFAAAWTSMGENYLTARQLDSAQQAFEKARSFPDRATVAQRYRLEANVAYAIHYDLEGAVRWYDRYLEETPYSIAGRSNRAVYESALGRYEDALADLDASLTIGPFGPEYYQINLVNKAAMLVVLGRDGEAIRTAADLTGPFRDFARLHVALARLTWDSAASIATGITDDSSSPAWLRMIAVTARAGALASRGQVLAAGRLLDSARTAASGSTARWYHRARLELAMSSDRSLSVGMPSANDTTAGGRLIRGLYEARWGDTASARTLLASLATLQGPERARIGRGPEMLSAMIAARAGAWSEVVSDLAPAALAGEHDPTFPDRPSSFGLRWLVGTAYAELGRLDSATVYFELLVTSRRVPPTHMALRGLTNAAGHARLAEWYERLGDQSAAARHWARYLASVVEPDSTVAPRLAEARAHSKAP